MKKSKFAIVVLLAIGTLCATSCKKDKTADPAPTPAAAATPVFSATVNGSSESWGTYYYQLVSGGTYINAFTGTQQKMQLIVTNAQVAGTYTIGTLVMANYWDATNSMHAASTGTITISSISGGKIAGTYSFTAGSYSITSGVFTDIPVQ